MLGYYDLTKYMTIQSDSSQHGLGCALAMEGQPVAFASRALTPTEQNYAQECDTLYWPGMQADIIDFVSKCTLNNEYAISQQKESMMSHELPTRPWQIVSTELFQQNGRDSLLIVDHYSDF